MSSPSWRQSHGLVRRVQELLSQSDALIFVGAGLSRWSGLPGWRALVGELAQFLENEGLPAALVRRELARNDLLQAASYGVDTLTSQQFGRFIRQVCRVATAQPHEVHRRLVCLPATSFITTNYDTLIESALRLWRETTSFQIVTNNQLTEIATIVQARAAGFVFKPHGDVNSVDSIILTREHYRTLHGERRNVLKAMELLLVSRPVLFVGFGLTDPDFHYVRDILSAVFKDKTIDHYAIVANASEEEIVYWRRNFALHLVPYAAPEVSASEDHSDLLPLLEALGESPQGNVPPSNGGIARGSSNSTIEQKTPSSIILALARHASRIIRAAPGPIESPLPLVVRAVPASRPHRPQMVLFDDVSVESFLTRFPANAVLLGAPGSGKTFSLLRHAATVADRLRTACLEAVDAPLSSLVVPLYVDLKLYDGDLWKQAQSGLPPDVDLGQLCDVGSALILIDSVNEMPRSHVENRVFESDLVSFLRLTKACRIVFAARTDDGLSAIDAPRYLLGEIASEFVERHLTKRGLLGASRQPGIVDLLRKPLFFRLHEQGRVEVGADTNVCGVYRSFFERLSDELKARFPSQRVHSVVEPLSELAYSLICDGREAAHLQEVHQALENWMGAPQSLDAHSLTNWLITSEILIPTSGSKLSFNHQSMTEFLAAVKLANLYRHDPGVLDRCLASCRWDYALFLTLGFLEPEEARSFIDRTLACDLQLAIRATSFLESDRSSVVARLLAALGRIANSADFRQSLNLGYAMRTLPVEPAHRKAIEKIIGKSGALAGEAAYLLVKAIGRGAEQQLTVMMHSRLDDYNFCTAVARALAPVVDRDYLRLFVDGLGTLSATKGKPVDELGIVTAAGILLAAWPTVDVQGWFGSVSRAPAIKREAFFEYLQNAQDDAAVGSLAQLVKQGHGGAVFPLHLRIFRKDLSDRDASWIDESLVKALLRFVESGRVGHWAVRILAQICRSSAEFSPLLVRKARSMDGIRSAALFCAANDPSECWKAIELIAQEGVPRGDRRSVGLFGIIGDLDWRGHEPILVKLFKLGDPRLIYALVDSITSIASGMTSRPLDLAPHIGPIDWWLDLIQRSSGTREGWFLGDRLGRLLVSHMSDVQRESCVKLFNEDRDGTVRAVLAEHFLANIPELSTDSLSEGASRYLLDEVLRESAQAAWDVSILEVIATERFAEEKILPLLAGASLRVQRRVVSVLRECGRRHQRRYVNEDGQPIQADKAVR